MKKIFIFSLISTFIVISSLSYVNYVLLKDSTINLININKDDISLSINDAEKIRYISNNSSIFRINPNLEKLLYTSNEILYSLNLSSSNLEIIDTTSFVSDFYFLNDEFILYASKKESEVEIYTLNLLTKDSDFLGSLSYKNFVGLKNVYIKDDLINFDIEYFNNGDKSVRSYVYKDNKIQRSNKSTTVNSLLLDGNYICETNDNTVQINGLTFTYNNNNKYSLIGVNKKSNILYLLNAATNENIISLNITDNIDILEDININDVEYTKMLVSDSLYLLGSNFIVDLNNSIKVCLDENVNIVYVSEEYIYFIYNNCLMKINY